MFKMILASMMVVGSVAFADHHEKAAAKPGHETAPAATTPAPTTETAAPATETKKATGKKMAKKATTEMKKETTPAPTTETAPAAPAPEKTEKH